MNKKTTTSLIIGIVTIAAFFTFAIILRSSVGTPVYESMQNITPESLASSSPAVLHGYATPSRLLIPIISVDAKVQHVGLTKTGNMGIPSNFTDVAWYKLGTIPGEIGSAVIDGHVDNALALPGVFKNLKKVKAGDDIYVVDKAGEKIHFIVTDVTTYNYNEAPAEEIFNQSHGKAMLRLITCGGTWIKKEKTYDERLIVTAEASP